MGNTFQRIEIIRNGSKVQILYNESNHISQLKFDLSTIGVKDRIFLEKIFNIVQQLNTRN